MKETKLMDNDDPTNLLSEVLQGTFLFMSHKITT